MYKRTAECFLDDKLMEKVCSLHKDGIPYRCLMKYFPDPAPSKPTLAKLIKQYNDKRNGKNK